MGMKTFLVGLLGMIYLLVWAFLSFSVIYLFLNFSLSIQWFPLKILATFFSLFLFIPLIVLLLSSLFYRAWPFVYEEGTFEASLRNERFLSWMLRGFIYILCFEFLRITPIFPWLPKLFGAKCGKEVFIAGKITEPPLTEIGEGSIIGGEAKLLNHVYEGKKIILRKIRVGKNCLVGDSAIILPGVEIGDNVIIGAGSLIPKNKKIPSNTVWGGNPVKLLKKAF